MSLDSSLNYVTQEEKDNPIVVAWRPIEESLRLRKTAHTFELGKKTPANAKAKNLLIDEALELMKNTKVSSLWIGKNNKNISRHLNTGLLFSVLVHLGILALFFKSPAWEISEWVQTPITNNFSVDILSAPMSLLASIIQMPTKVAAPKVIEKVAPIIPATKEKTITENPLASEEGEGTLKAKASKPVAGGTNSNFNLPSGPARTNYESMLANWLERYRIYPSSALRRRITGEGVLYVKVSKSGKVLNQRLAKSSGHDVLDIAIKDMVRRASPLPKIPSELKVDTFEFTVPVAFEIL